MVNAAIQARFSHYKGHMMLFMTSIILVLPLFSQSQTKGDIPEGYAQREDTEHFVFLWNSTETTTEEIKEAQLYSERSFNKLKNLLGAQRMPAEKIIMAFGGDAVDPVSHQKKLSHVDYQGRVFLFRYNPMGYLGPLLHELIHAIRKNTLKRWDRFFEEGIASALSYYLEPETEEFSRFGYPMEVIAGYWYEVGSAIPMDKLRKDHNRYLSCRLQTYVLREDFFTYLINTYGMKKYLDFAYSSEIGSQKLYDEHWGKPFNHLVSDWEKDLKTRYDNYPNARSLAQSYLKDTPSKYLKVCKAGVDF